MKQISLIAIILTSIGFVLTTAGCPPQPNGPDILTNSNDLETFPEILAGSWKADNSKWILTFDNEGVLTSMTHHGGMPFKNLSQGIMEEKWSDDINAVYILGSQPTAKYNPISRELRVHIVIEHYQITFPTDTLEGSFDDTLTGPVSPDNQTWNTEWRSKGTIIGGPDTDPNDAVLIKSETFRKLIPDQIK